MINDLDAADEPSRCLEPYPWPPLIVVPGMSAVVARWADMEPVPFRVTAVLCGSSPVAAYDPVHLDGLLAWSAMMEATEGRGLADSNIPYDLPVPLACLWRSERQLPLWASTVFSPDGFSEADTQYWHKRAPGGYWTDAKARKMNVSTKAGRWMERRVPVPVRIASSWSAQALGDPAEALRLLRRISHFGKKRGIGFGQVREWIVEPMENGFSLSEGAILRRPMPLGCERVMADRPPRGPLMLAGWTPPAWKPAFFAPCWPIGTPVAGG